MQSSQQLRRNAASCRELAETALTLEARDVLSSMATTYSELAVEMEQVKDTRKRAFVWNLQ